jgi:dTDP-4-amino-4,6-dideoxygalactose transaminase
MYYVLLADGGSRARVLAELERAGVGAIFHYVPLNSSPGGRRYARAHGELATTDLMAGRLIRLPLWIGLSEEEQQLVVDKLCAAVGGL